MGPLKTTYSNSSGSGQGSKCIWTLPFAKGVAAPPASCGEGRGVGPCLHTGGLAQRGTPFSRVCTEEGKMWKKKLCCVDMWVFPSHYPKYARNHPAASLRPAGLTTHRHGSHTPAAQEWPCLAGAKQRLSLQTSSSISFIFRNKLLHSLPVASADPSPC